MAGYSDKAVRLPGPHRYEYYSLLSLGLLFDLLFDLLSGMPLLFCLESMQAPASYSPVLCLSAVDMYFFDMFADTLSDVLPDILLRCALPAVAAKRQVENEQAGKRPDRSVPAPGYVAAQALVSA